MLCICPNHPNQSDTKNVKSGYFKVWNIFTKIFINFQAKEYFLSEFPKRKKERQLSLICLENTKRSQKWFQYICLWKASLWPLDGMQVPHCAGSHASKQSWDTYCPAESSVFSQVRCILFQSNLSGHDTFQDTKGILCPSQ